MWSTRVRAGLIGVTIALCAIVSPRGQSAPTVRVEGDHFLVNDNAAFLILVSYFDALRAASSAWATDLDWLKNNGVSGVRIFGNWHNYCTGAPVTDALIGPQGAVNANRMNTLQQFVTAAAQRGLLVDLSFDNEIGTAPITLAQYRAGLVNVAGQLSSFGNVLIDVDNEYTGRSIDGHTVTDSDVISMLQGVKQGDPQRLATASRNGAFAGGTAARVTGMDLVGFHDARDQGIWFTEARASASMIDIRAGLNPAIKPVYYQEPMPFDRGCNNSNEWDGDLGHAGAAIVAAKKAGAAAWTFHTRYGFDLIGTSLFAALPAAHRGTIQNLRAVADSSPWGAAAFTVSPTTMTVGAAAGAASVAVTRVGGSTANWTASTNASWLHLNASQGSGNSVGFTFDANLAAQSRVGVISISGRTVTVTQAGQTTDFNGDGSPDLVWRHSDGRNFFWLMNGINRIATPPFAPAWAETLTAEWEIRAVGDINGDVKPDVIWHNTKNGDLAAWLFDGTSSTGGLYLNPRTDQSLPGPDLAWKIVGIGDMDRDGLNDLIWQRTNGRIRVWHMNGLTLRQEVELTANVTSDAQWQIEGVGDMNGDGWADLVMRHHLTGQCVAWHMQDTSVLFTSYLLNASGTQVVVDVSWRIVDLADVPEGGAKDGKLDLIWQRDNTTANNVAVWYMNGIQVKQNGTVYMNPPSMTDANWRMAGVR
jgi:hypothetical protein